jgi:hypothetical protein
VTAEQATDVGQQFLAAALPCVESKVGDLIDHEALAGRFKAHSKNKANSLVVRKIVDERFAAHLVCAWQRKTVSYKVLHVHTVDGQPRPILRRVVKSERTGVQMVAYDELVLAASRKDHRVRVIDIYSYVTGQMLSELLGSGADATAAAVEDEPGFGALGVIAGIGNAKRLKAEGKYVEALAAIDGLPPALRRSRMVQMMRIGVANSVSQEAYKQALDEVAALFPDDPAIALVQIDADVLRQDYDAALHHVDVVDHAIGGDPWQDAIRAGILVKRNHPGDLEVAAQYADNVVRGEPQMSKGYFARLDVQLARKQTNEALGTMSELSRRFGAKWDDARLRTVPGFADLVATPEYEAWRAARQ